MPTKSTSTKVSIAAVLQQPSTTARVRMNVPPTDADVFHAGTYQAVVPSTKYVFKQPLLGLQTSRQRPCFHSALDQDPPVGFQLGYACYSGLRAVQFDVLKGFANIITCTCNTFAKGMVANLACQIAALTGLLRCFSQISPLSRPKELLSLDCETALTRAAVAVKYVSLHSFGIVPMPIEYDAICSS